MTVDVRRVGPEAAPELLEVVQAAFSARQEIDPPPAALTENVQTLAARLGTGGGLLAEVDGRVVGGMVLDPVGSTLYLRRFGVLLDARGHGVAAALIDAAVLAAAPYHDLAVIARAELPETIKFWERQGFREVGRRAHDVELRRPLTAVVHQVPDADTMRRLGEELAWQLRPGDLVVLSGELGAGKTTLAQGLGAGLNVRGGVTSPTFVISRVHPSLGDGPPLVHVDAYRLGGIAELDDLDLDTSLDDAVTVVEWGEGIAEGLAESRLEVKIVRALAHDVAEDGEDHDHRRVVVTPVGPRWTGEPAY